jgi:hypothetical protein
MSTDSAGLLTAFESRQMDNRKFSHREHMMVAWEMLNRYEFTDAVARYGAGIRELAAAAGAPDKYNATITIAFLSLVAERIHSQSRDSFAAFAAANPDLMTKEAVTRFYSEDRLNSSMARAGFMLPDRVGA